MVPAQKSNKYSSSLVYGSYFGGHRTDSAASDEVAGALHAMSTAMDDVPKQARDSVQVDALHLVRLFLSVKGKDDRAELLKIIERFVENLERRH